MLKIMPVILATLLVACDQHTQTHETSLKLDTTSGELDGTLLLPQKAPPVPVALIIAGSGPTDRNGNNPAMTNNSLKLLAEGLLNQGIASVRYDKRGIGKSAGAAITEADLRFGHFVDDTASWINKLNSDPRFSHVIVIGHSQGSLIGMLASRQARVDQFISLSGPAKPAGNLLKEQAKSQPDDIRQEIENIVTQLENGQTVKGINPLLASLFRPSIQPYLISWFKHNPAEEIKKLKIPVLVIQGDSDLQVSAEHAELLSESNLSVKKMILPSMNHILKKTGKNTLDNMATYNQPDLPLHESLIPSIVAFIQTAQSQ